MPTKFCPSCGTPREPNTRFCGNCGATYDGAAPSAPPAAAYQPPPSATPHVSAPVNPTGWQVTVGDGPPAVAPPPHSAIPHATASAPAAATAAKPAAQGASIRGPALQLLVVTVTDWAAAYATNEPTALELANLRLGLAAVGALTGLIAGRGRGWFSGLTQISSLGVALAQSPSLYSFGTRVLANPNLLSGLLPNIATQGLSFLAAIRLVFQARKG